MRFYFMFAKFAEWYVWLFGIPKWFARCWEPVCDFALLQEEQYQEYLRKTTRRSRASYSRGSRAGLPTEIVHTIAELEATTWAGEQKRRNEDFTRGIRELTMDNRGGSKTPGTVPAKEGQHKMSDENNMPAEVIAKLSSSLNGKMIPPEEKNTSLTKGPLLLEEKPLTPQRSKSRESADRERASKEKIATNLVQKEHEIITQVVQRDLSNVSKGSSGRRDSGKPLTLPKPKDVVVPERASSKGSDASHLSGASHVSGKSAKSHHSAKSNVSAKSNYESSPNKRASDHRVLRLTRWQSSVAVRVNFCNVSVRIINLPASLGKHIEDVADSMRGLDIRDQEDGGFFSIFTSAASANSTGSGAKKAKQQVAPAMPGEQDTAQSKGLQILSENADYSPTRFFNNPLPAIAEESAVSKKEQMVLQGVVAFIQKYVYLRFQVRMVAKIISALVLMGVSLTVSFSGLRSKYAPNFVDIIADRTFSADLGRQCSNLHNYEDYSSFPCETKNEHYSRADFSEKDYDALEEDRQSAAERRLFFMVCFFVTDIAEFLFMNKKIFSHGRDVHKDFRGENMYAYAGRLFMGSGSIVWML